MCDEHTARDIDEREREEREREQKEVDAQNILVSPSRRRFTATGGAVAVSGVLAGWMPGSALAEDLTESEVMVATADGEADAFFVHPAEGSHAAVLVWPDVLGLRDAYRLVGRRLAAAGYAALVVNPYYRSQKSPVVAAGASFQDEAVRNKVLPLARSLTPQTNVVDALAFVNWLDAQDAVDSSRQIGTTGYCMGGSMTLRTAAANPARVGAVASFHGGRLVTDDADSPHRLAQRMNASVLIAIAANDDERDPEAKDALRTAFGAADIDAEVEVYEGALHGWCTPDSRAYNEPQAERAWDRLLKRFATALA